MKKIFLIFILTLFVLNTNAQQFIGYTKDSIEFKLNQIHTINIKNKSVNHFFGTTSLVYDVYIPGIKSNITIIYNLNKDGICYQYLRLANISGYNVIYEYLSIYTNKIDDTHFIDDDGIIWSFHTNDQTDYFTLVAEKKK